MSFCLSTETFWWKMASAATSGNRGRCNSLCWWFGNWKPAPGTPCWHFYQWKDTSWEICQKRNDCSCKCTNYFVIINVLWHVKVFRIVESKNLPRWWVYNSFALIQINFEKRSFIVIHPWTVWNSETTNLLWPGAE